MRHRRHSQLARKQGSGVLAGDYTISLDTLCVLETKVTSLCLMWKKREAAVCVVRQRVCWVVSTQSTLAFSELSDDGISKNRKSNDNPGKEKGILFSLSSPVCLAWLCNAPKLCVSTSLTSFRLFLSASHYTKTLFTLFFFPIHFSLQFQWCDVCFAITSLSPHMSIAVMTGETDSRSDNQFRTLLRNIRCVYCHGVHFAS